MTATFSPWDAEHRSNPHPLYRQMRAEAPVYPAVGPVTGRTFWFLTAHDDAVAALRHKAIGKEIDKHIPEAMLDGADGGFEMISRSMLFVDPPDHTRLRRLVAAGFTPRAIAALEPRIADISAKLLAGLDGQSEFDLIDDYAVPLPVTVIAELLGVPAADHEAFRRWSKTLLTGDFAATQLAALEFINYMNDQINERRESPRDDLISGLVHAEDAGDRLDHTETLSMILLLLVAGHETTVNLIANGVRSLLRNRSQLELLQSDPKLVESAIEELLRYDGPVEITTLRWAFEDIEIGGIDIAAGEIVVPILTGANRDPGVFENPDHLDIRRSPNKHLAFGSGIHLCLGASLARLEGAVAIRHLLSRFAAIEPAIHDDELEWNQALFLRGMKSYPIAVTR